MIKLDENYVIIAAPLQFVLVRKTDGKTGAKNIGYYPSLAEAVNGYLKNRMLDITGGNEKVLELHEAVQQLEILKAEVRSKL